MRSGTADVVLETARRFRDAHARLGVATVTLTVEGRLRERLEADGLLAELAAVLGAVDRPHDVDAGAAALVRSVRHHGALDTEPTLVVELDQHGADVTRVDRGRVLWSRRAPVRDLHELGDLAQRRTDAGWLDVAVAAVTPLLADGPGGATTGPVRRVVLAGPPAQSLARTMASRDWRRSVRVGDRVRITAAGVLHLVEQRDGPSDPARPGLDGLDARDAAGAAVVAAGLLAVTGVDVVTCTDADRVDGVVLGLLGDERPTPLPIRLVEAVGDPTPHARQVAGLAVALFDGMHEVLGMGAADRDLLESAALVHDIARAEGPGHHRRAGERLLDLPVRGVGPAELVEVACIVRSQRGRPPGGHVPVFRRLAPSRREAVSRLVALLRLAEGLDLGRDGAVAGLAVAIDRPPRGGVPESERRLVRVEARGDRLDLALYGAGGTARYAERALGVRLVVRAATGRLAGTPA